MNVFIDVKNDSSYKRVFYGEGGMGWKGVWLVLSLSNKWSLLLYRIFKYLGFFVGVILFVYCLRCVFSTCMYKF